ncbi:MAG: NAD(P)-binding domain-containing protein, partial [Rhodanobacter sp.]
MIGLGRMGGNIVRRLLRAGHRCVVYDRDPASSATLADEGATPAKDIADLIGKLAGPRAIWLMLPAGQSTEDAVTVLGKVLQSGDLIIDGGNTFYRDDIRRAKALRANGVAYVDVGTSGGVWGLERGYCMMIGGARDAVERISPILR